MQLRTKDNMTEAAPSPISASLSKTIAKLHRSVSEGSYYEAQQMFKTVYARYRNKKALRDSYILAEDGARLQLTKGQLTCGVELAMLLAQSYMEDQAAPSEENLDRLLSVYSAFPEPNPTQGLSGAHPDPESTSEDAEPNWPVKDCVEFLITGVKWLTRVRGSDTQVQHLHGKAAEYIWRCMGVPGFGWATIHYIRANNKDSFAAALVTCMEQGQEAEEDLFVCRACLQTLAVATPSTAARQLQGCFTLLAELSVFRGGAPLPSTPLVHFNTFLLEALRKGSLELEQMLSSKYSRVLNRDPLLLQLLSRVEQVYLGVPPPSQGGMAGMLGDIMKSMMSGGM